MTATMAGVLLVLLCGIIEGVAQVFFKKSALAPHRRRLWIGAGIALFIVQALIYTGARPEGANDYYPSGSSASSGGTSTASELARLNELRADGAISDAEFEQLKQRTIAAS